MDRAAAMARLQARLDEAATPKTKNWWERYFPGFTEMVLESCSTLVQRAERFAQTGAGWVLRELSAADQGAVVEFVKAHRGALSKRLLSGRLGVYLMRSKHS